MEFLYEVTIIRKIPFEARLPALSHASLSTCTQQGCQGDVDQRSKKVECRVVVGGVPFQTLNPSLCQTLTLPALKTLGLSSVALNTTSHSPLSMIKLGVGLICLPLLSTSRSSEDLVAVPLCLQGALSLQLVYASQANQNHQYYTNRTCKTSCTSSPYVYPVSCRNAPNP